MTKLSLGELAKYISTLEENIDQTMLRIDASEKEYAEFVEKAERYRFRAVIVPQVVLPLIVPLTGHRVGTVVGFPGGYSPVESKLAEIDFAARHGAREVDVVINLIHLKSGKWSEVVGEISRLVSRAKDYGLVTKMIIETSALKMEEIVRVSKVVEDSGADFIKTNTGFGTRGVTPSDILLIKSAIEGRCKIKASGGIRTAIDAAIMLYLGAHVIGTSHGVEIAEEARRLARGAELRGG